ncbi:hypothetical protein TPHA_0K01160 [Tetrapisispora phaffii CBS 4417]|uniref:Uncharacterized protein n=1 Tax=Tetrapisispora phaffii (strain ATCC 24235 / CBS 4417 / NBRC 1672 / NRRL Y-8282 / UCD 70-5) TaxID=1071381 RepID=G8BZC2_TETPH|nr:hypothetical protein TPHA_0K01160 [Tetrapisispora phaffii CBS 4417]CCE65250.1 hypothetical protein TPHA_0K01160 [Tetrapisispora phaffii CBS 4417]
MKTGKFPPEVFKLILNQLDNISVYSVLDYINILKENVDSLLLSLILDKLCFIALTMDKDSQSNFKKWKSLSPILKHSSIIYMSDAENDKVIIYKESIKKIIFIVDENTIIPSTFDLKKRIDFKNVNMGRIDFDILLCSYSNIELANKNSIMENAVTFLQQLPEWLLGRFSNHLMIEFENDGNEVDAGSDLFGILSENTSSYYDPSNYIHFRQITFLNLKKLFIRYTTIDTYIFNILSSSSRNHYNTAHLNTPTPQSIFKNYLTYLNVNCPVLQNITFRESIVPNANQDQTPINISKYIEKCNFIDLTINTIEKFKNNDVNLRFLFQLHSLKNWELPSIESFTGHRFKFETVTKGKADTYSASASLNENLSLLKELILKETRDASPYFRLNLIPEGVKHTKIINWAPLEHESNIGKFSYSKSPILFLNCSSLEHLQLKPLIKENARLIIIQGLYLPRLNELTFYELKDPTSKEVMKINEYNLKESISVSFSSWNDISEITRISVSNDSVVIRPYHFVFNIDNLKTKLPKLSLSNSFESYIDERQKFIVV